MPYKRNGKWYTDFYRRDAQGDPTRNRVRKLLPSVTTLRDARDAENLLARNMDTEPAPLLIDYLKGEYLTWARSEKAAPEIDECHVETLCASPQFAGRLITEVSVIQIEGFKRERRKAHSRFNKPYQPGSLNAELNVLSRAFRLAVDSGVCRANPCRLVARFHADARESCILERGDDERLFAGLGGSPRYLTPFARAAVLTGMRVGELLLLDETALDFGRSLCFVRNPKWKNDPRKTEGLPLSPLAHELLLSLAAKAKGKRLFLKDDGSRLTRVAVSHLFHRRAVAAGFKRLRVHDLRHTFGTRLGDSGASPYEIARLMGHSNVQTSMRYVHLSSTNLRQTLSAAQSSHSVVTARELKAV
jgi:integrase